MRRRHFLIVLAVLAAASLPCAALGQAQGATQDKITSYQREMSETMFHQVEETVLKNYYDPKFHGVDMKARYATYAKRLQTATTVGQAFRVIASYLAGLHDSHTFFLPPQRSWTFFYGFRMGIIGDNCFVTAVRPGTDAAAKLHAGDQILGIDGYKVIRSDFNDLSYDLYQLEPRGGLVLDLRAPDGTVRRETVQTKFVMNTEVAGSMEVWEFLMEGEQLAKLDRSHVVTVGDVCVWKLPDFFASTDDADHAIAEASKAQGLVLDLRDDPGGEVDLLEYILGDLLPERTTIATPHGRKHQDPEVAKPHGQQFKGKLIVLVNSGSASSAELLARTIQLQHRGTVMGDRSAGAVMESQIFPESVGTEQGWEMAVSVTAFDLTMPDGKSLEKTGVTPDVAITPSQADMAAGLDPVLAKAVAMLGGNITPSAAGKLFPIVWQPYTLQH